MKMINRSILLILVLSFLSQTYLYGRRAKNSILSNNLYSYLSSISVTEEELEEKIEELFYWVDRYSNHRIRWNNMPRYIMRSFIELAADSLNKNSFIFRKSDFMEHFDIFGGKTLSGVMDFFKNEEGSNDIWIMRKELGIMPVGLNGWILFCKDAEIPWEHMPDDIKVGFLRKAAEELGKDIWELVESDFSHNHFSFLGERKTMAGFPNYFINLFREGIESVNRLYPNITEDDLELDNIYCMLKALDLLPKSDEEWIKYVAICRIQWAEIPNDIQVVLVNRMAQELGKEPYQLKATDFDEPLDFLNGKELSGLLNFYDANIYKLKKGLGIFKTSDDWIQFIQEFRVRWEFVPLDIQREIAVRMAEELGKEVYQLEQEDFTDIHFDFLNGKCLVALFIHHGSRIFDLRQNLDLIPKTYSEWLDKIRTAKTMAYWWHYIPAEIIYDITKGLANSLSKEPMELRYSDLSSPSDFLGGRNLWDFITVCCSGIDDFRSRFILPMDKSSSEEGLYSRAQTLGASIGIAPANFNIDNLNTFEEGRKFLSIIENIYGNIESFKNSVVKERETYWLNCIRSSNPKWDHVPYEIKRMLVIYLADFISTPVTDLTSNDFYKTLPIVDKALIGLFNYYGDVPSLLGELGFQSLN